MRTTSSEHNKSLFIRALVTWLLFIPIAILNGMIRKTVFEKVTGTLPAHQFSVVTGSVAFVVVGYFMLRKHVSQVTGKKLFIVGLTWVIMTIVFEFAMGYYINHLSWNEMVADYNLLKGRMWILVLLTISLTPWLVKKMTIAHARMATSHE